MIFQDPLSSLNPYYTVGLQIEEMLPGAPGRLAQGGARGRARGAGAGRHPRAGPAGDHYPHQFSGGQRQRIMIAMALVC